MRTSDRLSRQPFVLVADDDRDTRELYRACFDTNGYRTAEAGTGSQAIAAAVDVLPDVLLTDYVLPDVDGVTIARRLKRDARTARVHILLVTGYANPDLQRCAAAVGIDRVLLKPCLPQSVMREVARALTRPAARQPLGVVLPIDVPIDAPATSRVRDEYAALPGLSLTAEQARLVFDLERDLCDGILHALVAEGFLHRTLHGSFKRPK
jgi:CheY-like chemotaxis protein